jgi:hypothetical protein
MGILAKRSPFQCRSHWGGIGPDALWRGMGDEKTGAPAEHSFENRVEHPVKDVIVVA